MSSNEDLEEHTLIESSEATVEEEIRDEVLKNDDSERVPTKVMSDLKNRYPT